MVDIVRQRPPNFNEIVLVFPRAVNKGVIFAYDGKIYNPSNIVITPELMAHESIHCSRQGPDEESSIEWWDRYLHEPDYRYNEELLAHRAEYLKALENAKNRKDKRSALKQTSQRLASPLYGKMITAKKAAKEILGS